MGKRKEDVRIRTLGMSILKQLSEATHEMRCLEDVCVGHIGAIRHCEDVIESVAVDIASIATGGGEWDEMAEMMRLCCLEVPEDLDDDMRRWVAGDESELM